MVAAYPPLARGPRGVRHRDRPRNRARGVRDPGRRRPRLRPDRGTGPPGPRGPPGTRRGTGPDRRRRTRRLRPPSRHRPHPHHRPRRRHRGPLDAPRPGHPHRARRPRRRPARGVHLLAAPGATAVAAEGFYELLAYRGYEFGPVFQGVRATWSRGEDLYAEVVLPEQIRGDAGRFGIHPALLDAALHAAHLAPGSAGRTVVPFTWSGVCLHAAGATALRVRVSPAGQDAISVQLTDPTGAPVATIDALAVREIAPDTLDPSARAARDWLFRLDWTPVTPPAAVPAATGWAVLGTPADPVTAPDGSGTTLPAFATPGALAEHTEATGHRPDAVLLFAGAAASGTAAAPDAEPGVPDAVLDDVLATVQSWLADETTEGVPLVVVTRGAVPTGPADPAHDLPGAAVWGLVRSAQSQHPGRLVLADLDIHDDSWLAL